MNITAYLETVSGNTYRQIVSDIHYKPKRDKIHSVRLRILHSVKHSVKKILRRGGVAPDYDFFWTTAILVSGMQRVSEDLGRDEFGLANFLWFNRRFSEKNHTENPSCLDVAMHGYTLLRMYAAAEGAPFEKQIHQLADYLLKDHIRTSDGILPYRHQNSEMVYIDSIGMVCPFLAYYGQVFGSPKATDLAVLQILDFFEKGMCSTTSLPYHAYNSKTREVKGMKGWGRGAGWLVYGVAEAMEFIPKNHAKYDMIVDHFSKLIDKLGEHQGELGYLNWNLPDKSAHVDTSATAMFGYALARGVDIGILGEEKTTEALRCLEALHRSTNADGLVNDCSGECGGLGVYSRTYGAFPWAQGPTVGLAAILGNTRRNFD